MLAKPITIDWEKIEYDYRSGIKTLRLIASENGVSHVAINKRAKKDGWTRDLAVKIRAKANELVTKDVVTNKIANKVLVTEQQVVLANAEVQANVIRGQRHGLEADIASTNKLREHLDRLIASMETKDIDGNQIPCDPKELAIAITLHKTLVESRAKLIDKERLVFGLDNDKGKDDQPTGPDKFRSMSLMELQGYVTTQFRMLVGTETVGIR